MHELTKFLGEMRKDVEIKKTVFDPSLLNMAGLILENKGFEATKLFLWDSHHTGRLEKQAIILIRIIGKMEELEEFRRNRAIGSQVIKSIV